MTCIDRAAKTVKIVFFFFFLEKCCTKLRDKNVSENVIRHSFNFLELNSNRLMQHLRENMPWMTHSDTMTCGLVLSLSCVLRRSALLMEVIPGCYCWGQWHPGGWCFGQPVSMQSTVYNGSPHSHWPLSVRPQRSRSLYAVPQISASPSLLFWPRWTWPGQLMLRGAVRWHGQWRGGKIWGG